MKHLIYLAALASLLMACQGKKQTEAYAWETDLQERLRIDFCRTKQEVRNYIKPICPK